MHWLNAIDLGLLRFINQTLSNPLFDALMPFASGNRYFFPALILAGLVLLWKGGRRARLCGLMLALILWPGDSLVSNTIKKAVARPRPFVTHSDVLLPASKRPHELKSTEDKQVEQTMNTGTVRKPALNSMPSSHAFNWFAATMILLVYYRRSIWFTLPLAALVAFSRVYNGVHYPSDVLAGAILGAGYAAAALWLLNALWQRIGRTWFPLWWQSSPSLVVVSSTQTSGEDSPQLSAPTPPSSIDVHWLRLGYLLILTLLLGNLSYLAGNFIELSGDEAYQWIWSKHLALSYYSKPPLIAYTQFLGTTLWGDNEFGVRFFSPVISAILGLLVLRFFAREANARAGVFLVLILAVTPLTALGSVLMTVDPLSVLFWTAAMFAGWRAIKPGSRTSAWLWVGLWTGLGFLSKYTALFQWLCWAVLFVLWKPARAQLRRPGPYLALLINLLCTVPVLIWNYQHGWITVSHVVHDNAGIGHAWKPTLRFFLDFVISESVLLNPVFFVATAWAAIAFWRRGRHDPRMVYCFSMGAPVFLFYLLFSFHSRIFPNWIAPSVVPLFCLMALYWDTRWRLGIRGLKPFLIGGLTLGAAAVLLLHETELVKAIAGRALPPKPDPLTRVRGYSEGARIVTEARNRLLGEGKPVFIIASHYQVTGLMTFYIPEAKARVKNDPLVYCLSSDHPENQFYFWPGYEDRKGQNAIFVRELSAPPLVDGWISQWFSGETNLLRHPPQSQEPPPQLLEEFESVTDLGQFDALYRGRVFHTYQLYECRNLR